MCSKSTDKFFQKKKDWSKVKDNILSSYLVPYFTKIGSTNKMIWYIDMFSGKGIYDDLVKRNFTADEIPDYYGSPLIALAQYNLACQKKRKKIDVFFNFFEKKYYSDLVENIENFEFDDLSSFDKNYITTDIYCENNDSKLCLKETVDDLFRENKINRNHCVFCYVDPFGVKDLHMSLFEHLANQNFFSLEFLINFNSHGFFRAACAVKKAKIRETVFEEDSDLIEDNPIDIKNLNSKKCFDLLDSIMGGSKAWEKIIEDYNNFIIDGNEARDKIVLLYKNQIKHNLNLNYVLPIPIRFTKTGPCKYHMIFATNNESGAVLMGNNMSKREEYMRKKIEGCCCSLFEADEKEEEENIVKKNLLKLLNDEEEIFITKIIAKYYDKYEIPCCKISSLLKDLEKSAKITIERYPTLTKTGRKSSFMDEKKGQSVIIKRL